MHPRLMVSLMSVLLMLPPLGMGQAAPRETDRDRHERIDQDRDGCEIRGSDRAKAGEDRADAEQGSARAVRHERAAVERALRQAAAERDRALAQAQAEAAREGQPVKLRQQQTAGYEILTQCEDKREQ
jgi:hypothetical protein